MLGWVRRLFTSQPVAAKPHPAAIRARYDNAYTTAENERNWAGVDVLSARSANSYWVRRQLRLRSRHEVSNNPFLYGIATNNADDMVGSGPTLQLLTSNPEYNREVERSWASWCAAVGFTQKLRGCKLAKTVDGEGFLVLKTVEDLEHPVKLYPCDLEADQISTPAPRNLTDWWVDGVTLHPITGKPVQYHVLKIHPGDLLYPGLNPLAYEDLPARYVIHWFDQFRPGQVRGIPTFTSALDLFSELRSFRRATLQAAQIAADFAVALESEMPANDEDADAEYEPFKRVPIDRGTMSVLPAGMKPTKLGNDAPSTTYEMFQEKCLAEACRPLAYPLNLALGTSQKFNFSSAKLDHINYRAALVTERGRCEEAVLRPLFREWYTEAVLSGAIPAYDGLNLPPSAWYWPGFEPLDPTVDAQADHERLSNGTLTWQEFWARRGRDWRDVLRQQSAEQKEVASLGLQFGQPATKNITDNADDPNQPKAEPVAAALRAAAAALRAAGEFNEKDHPRAEDGKFGTGGGSSEKKDDSKSGESKGDSKGSGRSPEHAKTHGEWDKADSKREATRAKEDDSRQKARDKEDATVEKAREKEDKDHEKKVADLDKRREATDKAREKEDTATEKKRDKEDADHERKVADLDKREEKTNTAREKEDATTQKERDKADRETEKAREKEDKEIERKRAEEDKSKEPDDETTEKRNQEDEQRQAARDAEDSATEETRLKEDSEREAKRAEEDAAFEKERAELDKAQADRDAEREREDAERDATREKEDAALDAEQEQLDKGEQDRADKRAAEDSDREAAREREDAEAEAARDAEDDAEYQTRLKDNPDAAREFYEETTNAGK